MGDRGGVVVLSTGHEYVGVTHDSGIVSSADKVLAMSVVRGMRSWWSV